jgi:16S rRNA (guanine966-N2)-methyltransferase
MNAGAGGPFDFIFLDPPYRKNLLAPSLAALRDGNWLAAGALIVTESSGEKPAPEADGYTILDYRSYGDTPVALLRR